MCAIAGRASFRPREVLVRGTSELVRLPDHVIALMFADKALGDDLRENRRLTVDGEFEIANQLAAPGRDAVPRDAHGFDGRDGDARKRARFTGRS
jgi:hypothetical protein